MNIPDEAIEAAEEIIWQKTLGADANKLAHEVLAASVSFIAAQALRDAAADNEDPIDASSLTWPSWLRARADRIEHPNG